MIYSSSGDIWTAVYSSAYQSMKQANSTFPNSYFIFIFYLLTSAAHFCCSQSVITEKVVNSKPKNPKMPESTPDF